MLNHGKKLAIRSSRFDAHHAIKFAVNVVQQPCFLKRKNSQVHHMRATILDTTATRVASINPSSTFKQY